MAKTERRFALNPHGVVAEVIDDEAIIMNLNQGAYFSMEGSGATAWALLVSGWTPGEIAARLSENFSVAAPIILADLEALSERLLAEGLIVPAPDRTPELPRIPPVTAPYATPVLNKYGDMKEMLALDPPIPDYNG